MLQTIILPLALVVLMFGLGMTLVREDFIRIAQRKRIVVASVGSIFIAMPILALCIGWLFNLDVPLSMGLVLLAACPGGMFSNMVTHSARGDVALSVTLTMSSSLIYAIVAPCAMALFLAHLGGGMGSTAFAMLRMVTEVVGAVIVPLLAGMVLRRRNARLCAATEAPLRIAAALLVVGVFIWLGHSQISLFESAGLRIVGAVALLNLAGWTMARLITGWFRLSRKEFIAIGVEHSIRQEGVGVFVAVSIIGNPHMVGPLIVNSLVGFLMSIVMNGGIALFAGRGCIDNVVSESGSMRRGESIQHAAQTRF
jgi:BASS family bile acid:Na+ symporter